MPEMLPDLPHGPGFRLVSAVLGIEPGTNTVRCRLDLDAFNQLANVGHFPDKRRMPAVLQVETARQTLLGLKSVFPEAENLWPRIISLRSVKSPGRISAATINTRCVLFSLEDANAAAFTVMAGDRVATEGAMEFYLVRNDGYSSDGFQLVHRHIGVDPESGTVISQYDYTGEELYDLRALKWLPEPLALEAMVQGAIQIRLARSEYTSKIFWFTGIESAQFPVPIPRQGQLDLLATVAVEERGGRAQCEAIYGGQTVARAIITFATTRAPAAKA